MLWVHATLVDASLSAFQRFQRRLSTDDEERYHREMAVVAGSSASPPRSCRARSRSSATTSRTRSPARHHDHPAGGRDLPDDSEPPLPTPMRLLTPAHRLATAAQLPPRLPVPSTGFAGHRHTNCYSRLPATPSCLYELACPARGEPPPANARRPRLRSTGQKTNGPGRNGSHPALSSCPSRLPAGWSSLSLC